MSEFKGRHFRGEIVLWAVRWYCRYAVSYRDLEAMMTERGVAVAERVTQTLHEAAGLCNRADNRADARRAGINSQRPSSI